MNLTKFNEGFSKTAESLSLNDSLLYLLVRSGIGGAVGGLVQPQIQRRFFKDKETPYKDLVRKGILSGALFGAGEAGLRLATQPIYPISNYILPF